MEVHRFNTELAVSRTPTVVPGSAPWSRSISSGRRVCMAQPTRLSRQAAHARNKPNISREHSKVLLNTRHTSSSAAGLNQCHAHVVPGQMLSLPRNRTGHLAGKSWLLMRLRASLSCARTSGGALSIRLVMSCLMSSCAVRQEMSDGSAAVPSAV